MAAPVLAASNTATNASGTTHNVNLPASIAAGNLLIAIFGGSAAATLTWPAGWTQFLTGGATGATLNAAYHVANGTEASTISVTSGATSITSNIVTYRLTGAEAISPVAGTNVTISNSATGDPPSLASGWGTMDTLWVAISFASTQTVVNTFPTSYVSTATLTNGSTALATCVRAVTGTPQDPAAFTWAGTGRKNSNTIGIKPGTPIVPTVAAAFAFSGVAPTDILNTVELPLVGNLTLDEIAFIINNTTPPPQKLNNYLFMKVGDGMSTSEKIK